eukprot:GHVH01004008.1.p1 GENE.GHVH01004008.1~~GHVH01004008.1.p1  ORF type:complete len:300 (+),score=42.14 GHVH01004008.1:1013-1912(+)
MGILSRERRDVYYRAAKAEGYRARSAYKLKEIDEKFNIFEGVDRVVDLCAAPGSWSQYCVERTKDNSTKPVIMAVDLQEMAPISGVTCITGDITCPSTVERILSHFDSEMADIVICDGAPDVTGLNHIDEFIQSQLITSAIKITTSILRPGGTFIGKIFRGENISMLFAMLKIFFDVVTCSKPASSRVSSQEAFVVCQSFNPPFGFDCWSLSNYQKFVEFIQEKVDANTMGCMSLSKQIKTLGASQSDRKIQPNFFIPYITCGDLSVMDPDKNYHIDNDAKALPTIQPPIDAPYRMAKQ